MQKDKVTLIMTVILIPQFRMIFNIHQSLLSSIYYPHKILKIQKSNREIYVIKDFNVKFNSNLKSTDLK